MNTRFTLSAAINQLHGTGHQLIPLRIRKVVRFRTSFFGDDRSFALLLFFGLGHSLEFRELICAVNHTLSRVERERFIFDSFEITAEFSDALNLQRQRHATELPQS